MIRSARVMMAVSAAAIALSMSGAASAQAEGPTLADREAIEATLYRYTRGLDRGDPEMYASAFAPDGALYSGDTPMAEGREALAAVVQGVVDNRATAAAAGDPARQLYHMDANPSVEFLAPDHAVHHAYYLTLAQTGSGPGSEIGILAVGSTEVELRKIDGDWLIVKRTIITGP
jgi:uncharacterized protein (TIGR02246 family)